MTITKETLRQFLDTHPAISERGLSKESGLNESYISQLYNKSGKNLTENSISKLLPVLIKYGWEQS